jgi:alkaline phosphatase D
VDRLRLPDGRNLSRHPCARLDSSRRRLLRAGIGLAGIVVTGGARILAQPKFHQYPFSLGVASGEPASDGMVLWTRIAPDPLNGGGMSEYDLPVDWMVATDPHFAHVVRQGTAIASAEWAHSLHVEVDRLQADRWYWFRFIVAGVASPVGRTRTLPVAGAPAARLRIAVASCQHFEQGWFCAYRHMLDDDLDFIVHVGDYIYEGSWGAQVRRHESPRGALTLDDYRNRHACYKRDADLAAAHAAYPWLLTWDDHDVANDYAGLVPNDDEAPVDFAMRRAAAYRAYYEHMPLRAQQRPDAQGGMLLHSRIDFGDLVRFNLLDDRQYRSPHACAERGEMLRDCAQRLAPSQTMLGAEQEDWLAAGLSDSPARWNVLAQQTLIAPFEYRAADGGYDVWTDGWDGYAGARARLLRFVDAARVQNVIALGGDMHAFYVTDLKADFADPGMPPIATEFVGTSVTSNDVDYAAIVRDLPHNPHIRFFDSRWRGYLYCEITPELWRTDLRIVNDVSVSTSGGRTLASFHVEDGRPGAQT